MYKKLLLWFTLTINLLWATNANYNCVVNIDSCQKELELFDITVQKANSKALNLFSTDNSCMFINAEDVNCSEIKIIDKNLNDHDRLFYKQIVENEAI
jgi:hypothetical protein